MMMKMKTLCIYQRNLLFFSFCIIIVYFYKYFLFSFALTNEILYTHAMNKKERKRNELNLVLFFFLFI